MIRSITGRGAVRLVTYTVAAIAVCAGLVMQSHGAAEEYRVQLETAHTRALAELSCYLTNISTDMEKGRYTGTPAQLGQMSARIWRESAGAKSALSSLPVGRLQLEGTYKFLSQAGDYAMALSRKAGAGEAPTREEMENARLLGQYAARLRDYVDAVGHQVQIGQLSLTGLKEDVGALDVSAGFSDVEQVMTGYPTLIYDGPFSDHMLTRTPLAIQSLPPVTVIQAKQSASLAAQVHPDELSRGEDENSRMPSYTFRAGSIVSGVSKAGGYPTYMINSREIGPERVNQSAVFSRAAEYLKDLGIENMRATYYEKLDGVCTINFACVQDNVILYPDLVKVGVAMDDGGIVFYDARGYLSNHHDRTFDPPGITVTQASESLSPLLTVKSSKLALIPTDAGGEKLTFEFSTVAQDNPEQKILVYINAYTGAEENILLLLETPGGTLVK